jgi:hypothetical protein
MTDLSGTATQLASPPTQIRMVVSGCTELGSILVEVQSPFSGRYSSIQKKATLKEDQTTYNRLKGDLAGGATIAVGLSYNENSYDPATKTYAVTAFGFAPLSRQMTWSHAAVTDSVIPNSGVKTLAGAESDEATAKEGTDG